MIKAKVGAAGGKLSGRQSNKRKTVTKRVRGDAAGVSGSVDGGSGVGGELDGVADMKFIGVRGSPEFVEIKNYVKGRNFYKTVKGGNLVAAITHDVARVHVNPSCPENRLNILKVGLCISKEAQIVHRRIGKRFVVEFTKRHPLKLEGLTDEQFDALKEQIGKQGGQCFLELKKKIIGDREHHVQGRQRTDLDTIQPYLAEDDVPQEDFRSQTLKDKFAELVAEFASSNGKLLDAKGEAAKSALITFLKNQLQILEPAQWKGLDDFDIDDFDIFMDCQGPDNDDLQALI